MTARASEDVRLAAERVADALRPLDERDFGAAVSDGLARAQRERDRARRAPTVELPIDVARADTTAELDAHAVADHVEDLAVNALRARGVDEATIQAQLGVKS